MKNNKIKDRINFNSKNEEIYKIGIVCNELITSELNNKTTYPKYYRYDNYLSEIINAIKMNDFCLLIEPITNKQLKLINLHIDLFDWKNNQTLLNFGAMLNTKEEVEEKIISANKHSNTVEYNKTIEYKNLINGLSLKSKENILIQIKNQLITINDYLEKLINLMFIPLQYIEVQKPTDYPVEEFISYLFRMYITEYIFYPKMKFDFDKFSIIKKITSKKEVFSIRDLKFIEYPYNNFNENINEHNGFFKRTIFLPLSFYMIFSSKIVFEIYESMVALLTWKEILSIFDQFLGKNNVKRAKSTNNTSFVNDFKFFNNELDQSLNNVLNINKHKKGKDGKYYKDVLHDVFLIFKNKPELNSIIFSVYFYDFLKQNFNRSTYINYIKEELNFKYNSNSKTPVIYEQMVNVFPILAEHRKEDYIEKYSKILYNQIIMNNN